MPFDLSRAVRFDLSRGTVHAFGDEGDDVEGVRDDRSVLVPVDALFDLVAAAGPEVSASVGRSIGEAMGARVARRLGGAGAVREASLERMVSAVAMEVGIAGLGAFGVERWGRAMVLSLEHAPRLGGHFVVALLEGLIEAATGTRVTCALLSADRMQRVLVARRETVARVRELIGDGVPWAEALSRVQSRSVVG